MGTVAIKGGAEKAQQEIAFTTISYSGKGGWELFLCPVPIEKVTRIIGYGIAEETLNKNTVFYAVDDLYASADSYTGVNKPSGITRKIMFEKNDRAAMNYLLFCPPYSAVKCTFHLAFICEEGKTPLKIPLW